MTGQQAGAGTLKPPQGEVLSTNIKQRASFTGFLWLFSLTFPDISPPLAVRRKPVIPPQHAPLPPLTAKPITHVPERNQRLTVNLVPRQGLTGRREKTCRSQEYPPAAIGLRERDGGNLKQKQACSLLPFFLFLCTLETLGPAALSVKGGTPRA